MYRRIEKKWRVKAVEVENEKGVVELSAGYNKTRNQVGMGKIEQAVQIQSRSLPAKLEYK